MRVNSISNISFGGELYLRNQKHWTDEMKQAVSENKSIQKKLENYNVIGELSAKVEKKDTPYPSRHSKGDMIYKLNFIALKDDVSYFDRIKNPKSAQKYIVNQHYHSEETTVDRIRNLNMA